MNSEQIRGKWNQMKGGVKERWGKLTDDDISVINGQQDQLVGKVQERYGIAKEAAQKQVSEWLDTHHHEEEDAQKRKAS
jgi:uncharacterized protein YjbJ (UPF0337 family)